MKRFNALLASVILLAGCAEDAQTVHNRLWGTWPAGQAQLDNAATCLAAGLAAGAAVNSRGGGYCAPDSVREQDDIDSLRTQMNEIQNDIYWQQNTMRYAR